MSLWEKFKYRVSKTIEAWNGTYSKRLFTFITVNAVLWVWCSYGLAYKGRYEIAQELSRTAISCILGTVIVNASKSALENVSKYGWKGKQESHISVPEHDMGIYEDITERSNYGASQSFGEPTGFGDDEGIGGI